MGHVIGQRRGVGLSCSPFTQAIENRNLSGRNITSQSSWGDRDRVSECFFKALAINIVFLSFHCCPALDIHYDGSAGSVDLIYVLAVF